MRRRRDFRDHSRAIIDSLDDELMVIDSEYRVLVANSVIFSKHGMGRDDVIGAHCYEISHASSEPCSPPQHECPLVSVLQTGSQVRVNHNHTYYREGKKQERYVDVIATPIRDRKNKVIAVIELSRDVTEARQIESKITNLNRELQHKDEIRSELIKEIISIQEEERRRIAREMHDQTSQVLASLTAYIEATISMLPDSAEQGKAILNKAKVLSTKLQDDIHRLIYELRPTLLDDFGLAGAISWLADSSLSAYGISVELKIDGKQRRLPPQLETTIFRVIQEAITNIIKHSYAKSAKIIITFKKQRIMVSIRDNGKGFDVDDAISLRKRPQGLGLLGMKERIELVHGTLSIHSQSSSGTEINIEVPG